MSCGKTKYLPVALTSAHAAALLSSPVIDQARTEVAKVIAPVALMLGPQFEEAMIKALSAFEATVVGALIDFNDDEVGDLLEQQDQIAEDHAEALAEDFLRDLGKGLREAGLDVDVRIVELAR